MTWLYEQTSGRLYDPDKNFKAKGYSGGNCGKNPEGVNNHEMQNCHGIGPLPVGIYRMTQLILNHPHLGPFVIVLEPDPANEMFGRGDFRIHGDTNPAGNASEGCIIMPRSVREDMWHSDDHVLEVVAHVDSEVA